MGNYVSVPLTSVFANPTTRGLSVFVYNQATSRVEQRDVKEGGLLERDQVIITEGLEAGEKVVIAGTTRLVNGQQVNVLND